MQSQLTNFSATAETPTPVNGWTLERNKETDKTWTKGDQRVRVHQRDITHEVLVSVTFESNRAGQVLTRDGRWGGVRDEQADWETMDAAVRGAVEWMQTNNRPDPEETEE